MKTPTLIRLTDFCMPTLTSVTDCILILKGKLNPCDRFLYSEYGCTYRCPPLRESMFLFLFPFLFVGR